MAKLLSGFIDEILRLEKKYPNNADLGSAVRDLIKRFKQDGDSVE